MTDAPNERGETSPDATDPEEYGSLTIEDEGAETVEPADRAGTAAPDDADIGYSPDTGADADDRG